MTTDFKTGLWGVICLSCAAVAFAEIPCIVCDGSGRGDALVSYRGVDYSVHAGHCQEVWNQANAEGRLDAFVEKVEPRGALFQGDSHFLNPAYQDAHPIPIGWLGAGMLILFAVLSGGFAGGMAVADHRSVLSAFLLGFVFPGVGIFASRALPRKSGELELRGTKIALTYEETRCAGCGRPLHPSAARCPGCGAELTPRVESEVSKTRVNA